LNDHVSVYGSGRGALPRQAAIQQEQTPPTDIKHPVAARIPRGPVAAPSGRPAGIKYPSN